MAPVYFGYGNYETKWGKNYGQSLHNTFSDAGAVVLDNEYLDIEIRGTNIRIGGYMGYYNWPHMMTSDPEMQKIERKFFDDFESTEHYKILLNHIPTSWAGLGVY